MVFPKGPNYVYTGEAEGEEGTARPLRRLKRMNTTKSLTHGIQAHIITLRQEVIPSNLSTTRSTFIPKGGNNPIARPRGHSPHLLSLIHI